MSENIDPKILYRQAITGVRILLYLKNKKKSLSFNITDIDNLLGILDNSYVFYDTKLALEQCRGNNTISIKVMEAMIGTVSHDVASVLRAYNKLFDLFKSRLKTIREEFYAIE